MAGNILCAATTLIVRAEIYMQRTNARKIVSQ